MVKNKRRGYSTKYHTYLCDAYSPKLEKLTALSDGPHSSTQISQQVNTHNPNVYSESRLSPMDFPITKICW